MTEFPEGLRQVLGLALMCAYNQLKSEIWLRPFVPTNMYYIYIYLFRAPFSFFFQTNPCRNSELNIEIFILTGVHALTAFFSV